MSFLPYITDQIITTILDPYNVTQQAITRCKVCVENTHHPYMLLISCNTIQDWEEYFREDICRLYSKGPLLLLTFILFYLYCIQ